MNTLSSSCPILFSVDQGILTILSTPYRVLPILTLFTPTRKTVAFLAWIVNTREFRRRLRLLTFCASNLLGHRFDACFFVSTRSPLCALIRPVFLTLPPCLKLPSEGPCSS